MTTLPARSWTDVLYLQAVRADPYAGSIRRDGILERIAQTTFGASRGIARTRRSREVNRVYSS